MQTCVNDVRGEQLHIDGYNVLTTIETALSGGVVLAARDGTYRDIVGIHGSYRKVEETVPAIRLIGSVLAELAPSKCLWLLDSPVSNSGRLKGILLNESREQGWNWQVEIVQNPDAELCVSDAIVCTADSMILDSAGRWFNLARHVVATRIPKAFVVDRADVFTLSGVRLKRTTSQQPEANLPPVTLRRQVCLRLLGLHCLKRQPAWLASAASP